MEASKSNNLNVLIISFYFPPYDKVGGRRWAKHFKYFIKENVSAFVITGNHKGVSPWDKDISGLEDRIFRVNHHNLIKPFHLSHLPTTVFQKIKWKYSYHKWEFLKKKREGNYNDPALNNEENYLNKANEIIQEKKINVVVLSVGPFKYATIIISLKQRFPQVKFVIDYRDYWEDSLLGLTEQQVRNELNTQQEILKHIDLVLSPNQEMRDFYANKFLKPSYLLPHCIDEDDLGIKPSKELNHKVKLLYGGAFYHNIDENLSLIKKFVDVLNRNVPVEVDFYVSVKGYEAQLKHELIQRHEFIDAPNYFQKVADSDFVILILPPNRVNAMSSKFFELVAFRKPILYFGNEGEVSKFIINNKLGFHITNDNVLEQINNCIENQKTKHIPDLSYDISKHTFHFQTQQLTQQLQNL